MSDEPKTSPMMTQWHACKERAPDAIVLFRLGDFYEAFYHDAILLSKELDLTLTKRQEVPMSGIPHHTSEIYIDRLVAKGHKVAIAEQMEEPKSVKGLVKREVVRIVTPGTVVNSSLLEGKTNNFLVSIAQVGSCFGLAALDLTTAEFRTMEFETEKEVLDELERIRPAEVIASKKMGLDFPCATNKKEAYVFDHQTAYATLTRHFKVHNLDGFGLKGMTAAINAAGALLSYVADELTLCVAHITTISIDRSSTYLSLDRTTQHHLELSSLAALLDKTATPMGGRLLKQWVAHPLLSADEIHKRQEAIKILLQESELSAHLQEIRDLQRLIMRITTGYATPRDLSALRYSLEPLPKIDLILQQLGLAEVFPNVQEVPQKIASAIVDEPPLRLREGSIFRAGYHAELDELRALKTNSESWVANYQTELREMTQIKTLKVGFTHAFGYYIEVSRGQTDKMPLTFQRKQTLVNAERYISPELKEYEHKILTAEEKIVGLEIELFNALREEIGKEAHKIKEIAEKIARIDCLLSLALIAKERRYVRPVVDTSDKLEIKEGRHPVIEASLLSETFIPNDTHLDTDENRLLLITGPNMAGKSTYIRQVALIVILAQIGSFVPAKSAHIGVIDKLFTRIGASDDLSKGQSTFMVEMTETASILNNATARSLVILDEIGRGTSTYDGISIAWAVAEYLLKLKPKTLFATHYWELTELEGKLSGAINYHVAVHESNAGIVFLRKIVKGSTDKSYGVHVARLAGLPPSVIARAEELLVKMEKSGVRLKQKQLGLFEHA